ncbi:helix-turn-helix transcriptional regulator [Spirochaeta dissipatitropha]
MADTVVSNVRKYRTDLSLTQADLADKIGTTRQTVIAIEKGNYTPSVLLALKIARVLHKKVEELFVYEE